MRARSRRTGLLLFVAVSLAAAGCDQATKHVARTTLDAAPPISLAGDLVRFELVANPGAFMSLGAALPEAVRELVLVAFVPLLLAVVCVVLLRAGGHGLGQAAGVGLLAGGGAANWLDRLLQDGTVTDFVSLGIGPLRTGIFNLADVAILLGLVVVLWAGREPVEHAVRPAEAAK